MSVWESSPLELKQTQMLRRDIEDFILFHHLSLEDIGSALGLFPHSVNIFFSRTWDMNNTFRVAYLLGMRPFLGIHLPDKHHDLDTRSTYELQNRGAICQTP